MNRDQKNWLQWHIVNRPTIVEQLTTSQLLTYYNDYYSCQCESCEFRRDHGMMPIRSTVNNCTMPMTQLDLGDLDEFKNTDVSIR